MPIEIRELLIEPPDEPAAAPSAARAHRAAERGRCGPGRGDPAAVPRGAGATG